MFCRYFLTFFALFLIVAVVSVRAEEETITTNEDESQADPRGLISGALIKTALRLLGKTFKGAAGHCLKEAADTCKKHLFKPRKLIRCARDYFKENQASCVVDDIIN